MARGKYKYCTARQTMVNAETGEPTGTVENRIPVDFSKRLHVVRDYGSYDCPITGMTISGKAEHEANLKRHGVRVIEKGERRDAERQLEYKREATLREIDKTVDALATKVDL